MYKICVYAIAKNESENVEKWVESMRPADKIIVLDTGSTDDTVEKLHSLGVEVYEKSYEHFRFDVARNDCLDLVPDDYDILVSIDLDELFEQKNWADIVRENWDPDKPRMVYTYIWAHTATGEAALTYTTNKIHKKDPNLRWAGAIHEHLTYLKENTRSFTKAVDIRDKLTVHHYAIIQKSREFYLDLVKERLAENVNDPYSWVMAANESRVRGNFKEAIYYYKIGLERFKDEYDAQTLPCIYFWMGWCYLELEDGLNAWNMFSEGLGTFPSYRDNYYGLALLMLENGLIEMGFGTIIQALTTTVPLYSWLEYPSSWSFAFYDLLAQAYFLKEDYQNAVAWGKTALDKDPNNQALIDRYNEYLQALLSQKEQ